jgi:hypothetical protein
MSSLSTHLAHLHVAQRSRQIMALFQRPMRIVGDWLLPPSICDDPFDATRFPLLQLLPGPSVGVFKAWRNLSGPMGFQNPKPNQNQPLGRDHTASRWSAPGPGQRTRREDHALSHRPQMSSGRLFLDRVGRHQSPSPLHRRSQNNTHSAQPRGQRRHFYFARETTFLLCLDRGSIKP